MTTFLELCDPRRDSLAVSASDISWENVSELSKLHGITPFLFYRTQQLGIRLPEKIKKEWLAIYLYSLAQDQKARRQIKEFKEILDPVGVPFILLKGASAMLRLYPEPGLRTFCDLDILIPEAMISRFKGIMANTHYKPIGVRNSPEDEELLKFDIHLDPLWRDGSFMVEAHLNILGVKGIRSVANRDVWRGKQETLTEETKLEHLSTEHFATHTLLHYSKHLSNEGFSEVKWFIDLLYAEKRWRADWSKVMDIACRWGVEKEILPIMATLNHYWQIEIPLAREVAPLDLQAVVLGIKDREKESYAKLPTGYVDRLLKVRKLPDTASQVRYLFRLFFPKQQNLRGRYHLTSKWSIIPYYFVHHLYTWKKFLTGLYHQLLYHPQ